MKISKIEEIKDFKNLESRPINGGIQYFVKFKNNFGASIVNHSFSYGGDSGLWELAVIVFESDNDWSLCYRTHITDDVLGYLTEEEVNETIKLISEL